MTCRCQTGLGAYNAKLVGGQQIVAGQSLYSPSGNYRLSMQRDSNLVVYNMSGQAVYASGTNNSCGVRAIMQTDGNFVIYTSLTSANPSQAVWASGTQGHPGSYITMQDDGNLVIYNSRNQALWASKSRPQPQFSFGPNPNCSNPTPWTFLPG